MATVPKVEGMRLTAARKTVVSSGLKDVVTFENVADKAKDNIVLKQTPSPGTRVNPKSTPITLTVGRFPATLPPCAPIKPDSVNK